MVCSMLVYGLLDKPFITVKLVFASLFSSSIFSKPLLCGDILNLLKIVCRKRGMEHYNFIHMSRVCISFFVTKIPVDNA